MTGSPTADSTNAYSTNAYSTNADPKGTHVNGSTRPADEVDPSAWTLIEYRELVSLIRLAPGDDLPAWADGLPLTTVIWTETETTVICPTRSIPDSPPGSVQGPYVAFQFGGELDHTATGVLHALTTPLAEAQVPVLALSTFVSQWLLIPAQSAQAALASWRRDPRITVRAGESAKPQAQEPLSQGRP